MNFSKKEIVLTSFVVFAMLIRLLPHPPNFAPITAVALFAGTNYGGKYWAILMPLFAMVVTDIFLGFSLITPVVYLSFVCITLLGSLLKKISFLNILFSSLIFFITTNLGVWALYYPISPEGLTSCFTLALPFFANSIVGDLFFSGVLVLGYRFVAQRMQLA